MFDPYKILVSELMLQQTQVRRVIPKYHEFLTRFPDVHSLARASLGEVLIAWSGLGYNRRAKYLWQAAQIVHDRGGEFPQTLTGLVELPGVGKNTAGAIMAYAYDQPVVFIETNIRSVFIHHFFKDQTDISDKAILELVEKTLPAEHIREWYWSLMDYGTHLKQTVGNSAKRSKSYVRQSPFEDSKRQLRGRVLRLLHDGAHSHEHIIDSMHDARTESVLADLASEQLIVRTGDCYKLA